MSVVVFISRLHFLFSSYLQFSSVQPLAAAQELAVVCCRAGRSSCCSGRTSRRAAGTSDTRDIGGSGPGTNAAGSDYERGRSAPHRAPRRRRGAGRPASSLPRRLTSSIGGRESIDSLLSSLPSKSSQLSFFLFFVSNWRKPLAERT